MRLHHCGVPSGSQELSAKEPRFVPKMQQVPANFVQKCPRKKYKQKLAFGFENRQSQLRIWPQSIVRRAHAHIKEVYMLARSIKRYETYWSQELSMMERVPPRPVSHNVSRKETSMSWYRKF